MAYEPEPNDVITRWFEAIFASSPEHLNVSIR